MRESEFDTVFYESAEIIKSWVHDSKVYFLHNIGNWGDAIIRYGTIRFLNHYRIDFEELISENEIEKNRNYFAKSVLLYQGSGAFCRLWNHSGLIEHLSQIFYSIIVLPSTYEFHFSTPNTLFFCRDKYESKQNMAESIFCHDLAFFINNIHLPIGKSVGYFFRTDIESLNNVSIPQENNDISLKGDHFSPVVPFFEIIAAFEEIHTDRLHVGIVGSLLNRKVHLYLGSYFKNKAVYLSSIKDHYPNTIFHDDPSTTI